MNVNPENWIKLLFTYGPFALLVLFVAVIEGRARKALKESSIERETIFKVIYGLVWAVIISLIIFSSYVWYQINLQKEFIISGTFEELSGSEKIVHRKPNQDLYLCRRYYEKGSFSDQWRLVTVKKLAAGEVVRFIFDRGPSKESQENVQEYALKIHQEFYDENVEIRYDRKKNKLMLKCGNIKEEIPMVDDAIPDKQAGYSGFGIGVAHAGEILAGKDFTTRLESDDPIIRRDARMELAKMGEKGLPFIEKVLGDPKSSYRLRLGVITALGTMDQVALEKLNQTTLNAIIEASMDKDEALRRAALRFFGKHSSEAMNTQLKQALAGATQKTPVNKKQVSQLARAQFEVLYNLGIREKDDAGEKLHDGKDHFQAAVTYFEEAWKLRTLADPGELIYFTKALYGWGHALHDRSMIEKVNGERQPEMVKAAQEKFREFVKAYEQAANKQNYPYKHHEDLAKAYVETPESNSLRP